MADTGMAELIDSVVAYGRAQLPDDAKNVEVFLRHYFDRTAPDDLRERSEVDLLGSALAHWDLARRREPHTPNVRVYLPLEPIRVMTIAPVGQPRVKEFINDFFFVFFHTSPRW